MTQEEKDFFLKDLYARLPYGVHCYVLNLNKTIKEDNDIIYSIVGDNIVTLKSDKNECYMYYQIKPYLRPMSSMTEEEAKDIAILHDIKDILSVKVTSDYIDVIVDDGVCSTERRTIWYDEIVSSVKCFDFLTAHHFDYRGLIEKGLAIEAPEGMYN